MQHWPQTYTTCREHLFKPRLTEIRTVSQRTIFQPSFLKKNDFLRGPLLLAAGPQPQGREPRTAGPAAPSRTVSLPRGPARAPRASRPRPAPLRTSRPRAPSRQAALLGPGRSPSPAPAPAAPGVRRRGRAGSGAGEGCGALPVPAGPLPAPLPALPGPVAALPLPVPSRPVRAPPAGRAAAPHHAAPLHQGRRVQAAPAQPAAEGVGLVQVRAGAEPRRGAEVGEAGAARPRPPAVTRCVCPRAGPSWPTRPPATSFSSSASTSPSPSWSCSTASGATGIGRPAGAAVRAGSGASRGCHVSLRRGRAWARAQLSSAPLCPTGPRGLPSPPARCGSSRGGVPVWGGRPGGCSPGWEEKPGLAVSPGIRGL